MTTENETGTVIINQNEINEIMSKRVISLDDLHNILLISSENIILLNDIVNYLLKYKNNYDDHRHQILIQSFLLCINDYAECIDDNNQLLIDTFLYFAMNFIDNFYKVLDISLDKPSSNSSLRNTEGIKNEFVKNKLFNKYQQLYLKQLIEFDEIHGKFFDEDLRMSKIEAELEGIVLLIGSELEGSDSDNEFWDDRN